MIKSKYFGGGVLKYKKLWTALIIIFCLFLIGMMVKAYFDGNFDSVETLQEYIKGFGPFGPIILTIIQALQVILPILPGFLGCAVGAILFGPVGGFICNYVGISAGSIIAFLLAKKYGASLVESLISKEKYDKYAGWAARSKSYTTLLFWGMVLPLFPDDFFCYFSGITKMTVKKFTWIIIIGKPWCILAYSLFFDKLGGLL